MKLSNYVALIFVALFSYKTLAVDAPIHVGMKTAKESDFCLDDGRKEEKEVEDTINADSLLEEGIQYESDKAATSV
ncbi:MAG: hypothetical protein H6621_05680 [Halobacteriovoraceae bacterium]|nr:hypothetical protein [Halobacteriovoraceae bacterium]